MRKIYFIILLILSIPIISQAAFQKGDVEFGTFLTAGASNIDYSNYGVTVSQSTNFLIWSVDAGYYVKDNLSIGPEYGLMAVKNVAPASFGIINLSYTFEPKVPKFAAYIKGGVGLGNGLPIPNIIEMDKLSDNWDVTIYQVGTGIKFLFTNNVLLKGEINYRTVNYTIHPVKPPYKYSESLSSSYITFFIGMGIIID